MKPQEAKEALKIEQIQIEGKAVRVAKFFEGISVANEALEKQIPKKVETLTYQPLINLGWEHRCPNCGCAVGKNKNLGFAYEEYLEPYEVYCSQCGQALDWSDTE